jgi:hypothetical protein
MRRRLCHRCVTGPVELALRHLAAAVPFLTPVHEYARWFHSLTGSAEGEV